MDSNHNLEEYGIEHPLQSDIIMLRILRKSMSIKKERQLVKERRQQTKIQTFI